MPLGCRKTLISACFILAALSGLLGDRPAWALGLANLETTSYFRHSTARPDTSTVLDVEPSFVGEGPVVAGAFEARALLFTSDPVGSLTFDLGDAYVATSPQLLPHHQLSAGRRKQDWSTADQEWGLGLWEPRFTWDPLRPRRDGLSGFFYNYHSKFWRLTAFASPLSVPDRSFPVKAEGGRLTSSSPDFVPPYQATEIDTDQAHPRFGINYSIAMPPLSELLLNAGFGTSVRFGGDEGFWTQLSGGILPSHQLDLMAEFGIPAQQANVDSVIHPRSYSHRLLSAETGVRGTVLDGAASWAGWVSETRETPMLPPPTYPSWTSAPIGTAWIAALGASVEVQHWFRLRGAGLMIREEKPAANADQANLTLPPRFWLTQAARFSGTFLASERWVPEFQWTRDFAWATHSLSVDLAYHSVSGSWQAGVGGDLFFAKLDQGFYGAYAGNDRVRARVAYAF